ncbi:MAG: hypothetical protein QG597_1202, partial [Actinomycetota bacterium]|nr:hypothetical protein [Actinomycetota bacterium]
MADEPGWVSDTTCYTHLCRAGHDWILARLAPGGVVVVPADVEREIDIGRSRHVSIPSVASVSWAESTELTHDEALTSLVVKAQLGGGPHEHIGECAVIACAHHRRLVAILDDRAAVEQARLLGVRNHGTLWVVIEAYNRGLLHDRDQVARVVDDLIATGMYLPTTSG